MGKFDYLANIGRSKKDVRQVKVGDDKKEKIDFIELLSRRYLIPTSLQNELITLYIGQNASDEILDRNIEKCVFLVESAELKVLSLDEVKFKLKNSTPEFVGSIPLMPGDHRKEDIYDGKVSYDFAQTLVNQLKDKTLTIKDINSLSDIFRFDLFGVIKTEQINIPEG